MMEELIKAIMQTYGLLGIILISPFVALYFLWADNKGLRKQLAEANTKVVKAQEQRVEDVKAIANRLIEMSSENAALTKETNIALDRVGDTLTVMVQAGFYRPQPSEGVDPPLLRGTTKQRG
jgi:hypothetical protein